MSFDSKSAAANLKKLEEECTAAVGLIGVERIPPAPLIYHYTDESGLAGIINSGTLWLSDIYTLNDPSELTYGLKMGIPLLREIAPHKEPDWKESLGEKVNSFLDDGLKGYLRSYVCSLSSSKDDIHQWRAYADNGRGFGLAFETSKLISAFKRIGGFQGAVVPMSYGHETLTDISQRVIAAAKVFLDQVPTTLDPSIDGQTQYALDLCKTVFVAMSTASMFHKHPAYAGEREVRLLRTLVGSEKPEFKRTTSRGEVDYVKFDWLSGQMLRGVMIGPAAPIGAEKTVTELLKRKGLDAVGIERCEIPYRC